MADRRDALLTREYQSGGETKTSYTKVGVAFPTRNGGYSVKLEAMPAPVEGTYNFVLFPPRQDDTQPRQQQRSAGGGRGPEPGDIPFSPAK